MTARVLVVEDSASFRKLMSEALRQRGYETYEAWSLGTARSLVRSIQPSVVLLDLELDGEDGYELLTDAVRESRAVIVISARHKSEECVRCLSLGAADYIVKPIDFDELDLRIRRAEKLHSSTASKIALSQASEHMFDLISRRIVAAEAESDPLSPTEFRLLSLLLQQRGRVFGREEIARYVLGRVSLAEGRSIDVLVSKLRRKLQMVGAADLIESVRGLGYRLSEKPPSTSCDGGGCGGVSAERKRSVRGSVSGRRSPLPARHYSRRRKGDDVPTG